MKPGVFTQMYIQLVFAVKNRETLLRKHHQKMTFREEYLDFLNEFKIDYDERFLFDFFD